MAEDYIVIGAKDGKRAEEAKDIESLIIAHKDGSKEEIPYHPTSTNPGQDVMKRIDDDPYLDKAGAVITGIMVGPPKYGKRAIIQEEEENITKIVEKYNKGEYDSEIDKYPLESEEAPPDTRRKDSSGGGVKANQKENGDRKTKGEPRGRAYESGTDYEGNKAEPEESESEEGSESEGESSGED